MIIVSDIFMIIGCFFALAGTVGMIRMPDSYCRMQSSTNIGTLGALGVVIGAAIRAFSLGTDTSVSMGIKILLIGLFVIITNPIAGHAICRAAYKSGVRPQKKFVCDEYGRDNPNE